jgi:hypothetical protein
MPDNSQSAIEASRHVGDVELTPSPTVAPNVIKMDDMAAAARPPAMIGDHCSDQGPSVRAGVDVSIGDSIVMAVLSQAEERKDGHNDDDKPN